MSSIGENIKRIRKERGLTQEELGNLCEPQMKGSAIRRYENEHSIPKRETLQRIAHALNVPIFQLDPSSFNKRFIELFSGINGFDFSEDSQHLEYSIENLHEKIEAGKEILARTKSIQLKLDSALLENFHSLNAKGQEKALEQVNMLTKIPEYQRENK